MSYLRRIASRVTRQRPPQDGLPLPNAVTVPTMKIQSPLVEADQRLSIPTFAEIRIGENRVKRNAFDGLDDAPEAPQGEPVPIRNAAAPPKATIASAVPSVATTVGTPEVSQSATSSGAVEPLPAQAVKPRIGDPAVVRAVAANRPIEPSRLSDSEPGAAPNAAAPNAAAPNVAAPNVAAPNAALNAAAPKSRSSNARTGRQDILGALSTALSRVDSWMASDTNDSSSAVAQTSSEPHQMRQSAEVSETTGTTPAPYFSTFQRVASRVAGLGQLTAASSSTVASGFEPAARGDTGPALEHVLVPSAEPAARVRPMPFEEARPSQNGAPNWRPTMPEPSVVSIGRIDVEVVPPPPFPVPVVSSNVANRASRSSRAPVGCEATQRAFGWRQS